ncbi:DUF86 domain-containing protein [Candidatus Thiodictyon syntrophicum]|uniref:HepT-like ribonuclease domain-containing protein n=1 Tax=Candidatus Thiodictyon syntrophicum TaxID=1166950 RepID=UPI003AAFF71A
MKPARDADRVLLAHIRECIERIVEYTGGDRSIFIASRLVQDAVVRNLQTLAESTQRLSDSLKTAEPGVPWRAIAGFRNVLTHGYLGPDYYPHLGWPARGAGAGHRAAKLVKFVPIASDGAKVDDRGTCWQAVRTAAECGGPGDDSAGHRRRRPAVARRGGATGLCGAGVA